MHDYLKDSYGLIAILKLYGNIWIQLQSLT